MSGTPPERSSHARLRRAIERDRARIAGGEHLTYHALWAGAPDGSIDVTVVEMPLIHQFVPDEASVLDGARFLIARTLGVDPGRFDVLPARRRAKRRLLRNGGDVVGLGVILVMAFVAAAFLFATEGSP